MIVAYRDHAQTEFLNVDLDVEAAYDLAPLAKAFGPAVLVLYCGKAKRGYVARIELARQPKTPDEAIGRLTARVARLPPFARRLWRLAKRRDFSIGVQSGSKPWCSEFALRPATLASAARLDARITLTVYGEPRGVISPGVPGSDAPLTKGLQRTKPARARESRR